VRLLSLTARMAAYAEQTGEVVVGLVTISHPSLDTPLRFSSDPTTRLSTDPLLYGTASRGNPYNFLPMSIALPEDSDDTPPATKLVIDNVARDMIPTIRSVSTPGQVTTEFVLASSPDTVEATWPNFDLVNSTYDSGQVTCDLTVDAMATEPFPYGTFTPAQFPGLFG